MIYLPLLPRLTSPIIPPLGLHTFDHFSPPYFPVSHPPLASYVCLYPVIFFLLLPSYTTGALSQNTNPSEVGCPSNSFDSCALVSASRTEIPHASLVFVFFCLTGKHGSYFLPLSFCCASKMTQARTLALTPPPKGRSETFALPSC